VAKEETFFVNLDEATPLDIKVLFDHLDFSGRWLTSQRLVELDLRVDSLEFFYLKC
jgi:hypothetical protein